MGCNCHVCGRPLSSFAVDTLGIDECQKCMADDETPQERRRREEAEEAAWLASPAGRAYQAEQDAEEEAFWKGIG